MSLTECASTRSARQGEDVEDNFLMKHFTTSTGEIVYVRSDIPESRCSFLRILLNLTTVLIFFSSLQKSVQNSKSFSKSRTKRDPRGIPVSLQEIPSRHCKTQQIPPGKLVSVLVCGSLLSLRARHHIVRAWATCGFFLFLTHSILFLSGIATTLMRSRPTLNASRFPTTF